MSGILICCICCIIYIATSCYCLCNSETCNDLTAYCNTEYQGDTVHLKSCNDRVTELSGILNRDPAAISDTDKKRFSNFDKYVSSFNKFKAQEASMAKLSCRKKLALSVYYQLLMLLLAFSSLGGNTSKDKLKADPKFVNIKAFFTTMNDADATTFINDQSNKGDRSVYNVAYGVGFIKNPNYSVPPMLPSLFDRTMFSDLFEAFGM